MAKQIKSPTDGVKRWGTGVQNGGVDWATNYLAVANDTFSDAKVNPEAWQAGVSDPDAATRYHDGMVSVDKAQLNTTVNGAGKIKFQAAGTAKTTKYLAFANIFYPKLNNIRQNLDSTSPRGRRGSPQNRSRLNAYLDMVAATRGQN